ncbi:GW dipeptide domain-containing protein [Lutimonas zeaxanthinifaciens]|uniref:GW dipeptide domain-containing protein n=1 Tax=Lutimonas zeaxanthinifaciens TaxID=3060215 RepID=UPI00265CAD88|nr:GW dipeptide domain-containing protein [Lutimonas sp. YSD2104]WKK65253.1 GW dipeptide domain-containing protein [Lutimonas sp. YSD2104]
MRITFLIICFVLTISCENKKKDYSPVKNEIAQNEVVVKEIQQTSGYTYLLVTESGQEFWLAVTKTDAKEGDKLYFTQAMEMSNFESKELNRVFDRIFFVDQISKEPIDAESKKAEVISKRKMEIQRMLDSIKISPAEGGQSIGELYANSKDFNKKKVRVRGQVVKVNKDIMDRNWVHLMDGTTGESRSDLTFTTQENVQVGDTVVFEGILAIDREFGAGYVYPLIVEEAVLR